MIGEVEWTSLLDSTAPSGCRLQAALFTSYQRPEERFLVEHLLPALFGLTHDARGEGRERERFFMELTRALETVRGHLGVITSMPRPTSEVHGTRDYPWLWRYMQHHSVGRRGQAVQHAKLWLFLWGAQDDDKTEYLEIVISSANLSRAAFNGQIQAAWRCVLALEPTMSKTRLATWGVLPEFLRHLGEHAGSGEFVEQFVTLLGRSIAPADVDFVASVPGQYTPRDLRSGPWGTAGLQATAPPGNGRVKIRVMAPYVGTWSQSDLARWCDRAGTSPDRLELVWIDRRHPWAGEGADGQQQWILPRKSREAFIASGVNWLRLEHPATDDAQATAFHTNHRAVGDRRWSHSKVYHLRRGTSQRLLVTSANFSTSAWGRPLSDGGLQIANFEIGALLHQADWPMADDPGEFEDPGDAFALDPTPAAAVGSLTWVASVWDGKTLVAECRFSGDPNGKVRAYAEVGGKTIELSEWQRAGEIWRAKAALPAARGVPHTLVLSLEGTVREIAIRDERPAKDIPSTEVPEVAPGRVEELRDEMFLEEYGAGYDDGEDDVDGETTDEPLPEDAPDTAGPHGDSYSIPAFEEARQMMTAVDGWAARMQAATSRPAQRAEVERLLRDGRELVLVLQRRAARFLAGGDGRRAIGPRLASEELEIHLRWFEKVGVAYG